MRKLIFLLLVVVSTSSFSQINVMWESRYNSASNNVDRVADMYVDASGNAYVTGSSLNAVTGASGFDFVTIKYNSLGVQQWIMSFNGSGNGSDNAVGLAVDGSGNVYVAGTSYRGGSDYDFCVIKYDNSGILQWQVYNGAGVNYDEAKAITLDPGAQPIIVGGVQPTATNTNYRTLKLNSGSGTTAWSQDYSSAGSNLDLAIDVVTDASSNVFVTGYAFNSGEDLNVRTIKYNNAGVLQWNTQRNQNTTINSYDMPSDIAIDAATGNVFVLATVFNGTSSDDDIYIIKYNSTGTITGTVELDGSANGKDKPNMMLLDASSNIYITGKLKGVSTAEDMFVAKYNSSLVQQWIDKYNGESNNYDEGYDLSFDLAGTNILATGYSLKTVSNNDYVTIKYDVVSGTRQWITRFNGPANNSDQAKCISIDGIGNIYVSGDSKGSGTNYDYSTIKYCQLKTIATVDADTGCVGTVFSLNATGGATSTVWAPATSLSCTTCSSPMATPTSDICYIVTTTDAAGCSDDDTICIVINPLPGPVITPDGPTTFCIGDSVGLAASGFTDYLWNTGETTSTITTDTAGTYSVTVTDAQGCQNFTNILVTVNNLPVIDAGLDQEHCAGDSSQITASGGVSYVWNTNPDLTSTTIGNPYSTAYIAGNYWYYVTGTDVNGCQNFDSVMVTVHGLPAAPILFRPANTDLILANYSTGVDWYLNGVYLPAAGSGSTLDMGDSSATWGCQAYVTNSVSATYTDGFGCTSIQSDTMIIDTLYNPDCYIGFEEFELLSGFNVYPNPTQDFITIDIVPIQTADLNFIMMDLSGKVVINEKWNRITGAYRKSIDISELSNGIYQVILRDANGNHTGTSIIKQ